MNVLMFVSNPFTSDPRVYNEATSLIQAGHEVTVVACDSEREYPPSDTWDGIEIIRLAAPLPTRHGFGGPLWNGFGLLSWQWQAYRQALKLNEERRIDVVHCHDLDTLAIGVRLERKLSMPLVYDAHEIYGYAVTRTIPRWTAGIFFWLEKQLVKHVDRIINVCEPQRRYFDNITDKPISIIMNCKTVESPKYEPPASRGDFTILYIGILHQGRAVSMLVDAVRELAGVRCIIGGFGLPTYVRTLKEKCDTVANADFVSRVPFDQVMPLTKKADAIFFMVNPQDRNNRLALANKQFEAMVCGRPIICSKGTYSGELTEQEQVGLTVEYDREALKDAIIKLRDNPELREELGRNALHAAITKYNWQNEEEKLTKLYGSIKEGCVNKHDI